MIPGLFTVLKGLLACHIEIRTLMNSYRNLLARETRQATEFAGKEVSPARRPLTRLPAKRGIPSNSRVKKKVWGKWQVTVTELP